MNTFKNKKIAVIGAGVEGVSSAKFLEKQGADVTILDRNKDIKILGYKDIKLKTGENYLEDLDQYDLIVRSPGIKLSIPEIQEAQKKGVEITSQIKLFFDVCPAKIIGVTGTKGKGTTATLIYEMLKRSGKDAYLGGNIGRPPLDFLNKLSTQSIVVLELSSFQLLDLTKSPHIAVLLMITSEHIDYHKDTSEYIDAKRNLVRFQTSEDFAIINRDYPASNESDIYTKGKVFQVSRERECNKGCFVKNGKIIVRYRFGSFPHISDDAQQSNSETSRKSPSLSERQPQTDTLLEENSESAFSSSESGKTSRDDFIENEIINIKDIFLPGEHNLENVCAAVMAATLAGVSKESIVSVLKSFKGLEHRLELVGEVGGVKYYDDSFSTTPETAIAAILAFKQPEILILGGSSKNSDFSKLGEYIRNSENIKAIIGIGVEWEKIKLKIKNKKVKIIEGCKNMKEIAKAAFDAAERGDIVLLSPGCASFGMFKNYKDRGEQFKKEVKNLK